MEKLIVSAAVVGGITIPTQTPYLPITPQQIADEAIAAANAGAACVHIHARNPADGRPTVDLAVFKEIITRIKEYSDVVIGLSTGVGAGFGPQERIKAIPAFRPELASCNMGSSCLSARPLLRRYRDEDYKFPWEKGYIESMDDFVLKNTFTDLDIFLKTMKDCGTRPEHEVYEVGHIYNVAYYFKQGVIEPPIWLQFVTGGMGAIGCTPEDILHMKHTADRLLGAENYHWSVIGVGYPYQFTAGTLAIMMGGHVRVGLEDNILIKRRTLARSNVELVDKIVRISREFDREIATPNEVRELLKLKGKDRVNF